MYSMTMTIKFEKAKEIFKEYPYIAAAYLYGSFAKGGQSPMSDVDIAILLNDDAPQGRELIHEVDYLTYRVAKALAVKEIDLIELNRQGLVFIHNVLKTGKLIYDAVPGFRIKFTAKIISEYCDFEPTVRFMDKYYYDGYRRRLSAI